MIAYVNPGYEVRGLIPWLTASLTRRKGRGRPFRPGQLSTGEVVDMSELILRWTPWVSERRASKGPPHPRPNAPFDKTDAPLDER